MEIVKSLFSGLRQVVAVAMILFGSLLTSNVSFGPCGGTILANEPFPAIFFSIAGLELILCSYFVVRRLKAESDFRVIIYLFLTCWSLSLLSELVWLARSSPSHSQTDLSELSFTLLRGGAAALNLVVFYRWAGTKNMITRFW